MTCILLLLLFGATASCMPLVVTSPSPGNMDTQCFVLYAKCAQFLEGFNYTYAGDWCEGHILCMRFRAARKEKEQMDALYFIMGIVGFFMLYWACVGELFRRQVAVVN